MAERAPDDNPRPSNAVATAVVVFVIFAVLVAWLILASRGPGS